MRSVSAIRQDFPMLNAQMNGHQLAYLDNGATTQKPASVIETLHTFYQAQYATIHRGVYQLSQEATAACDLVREKTARFIHAQKPEEIIFTRGSTEAINLVASSFGKGLKPGQEIIVTEMEHHSNFVPWQQLCLERGLQLKVVPILDNGELDLEVYEKLLSEKTALVSIVHVSNALGTVNPVKHMTQLAKKVGAKVLLDGAQAIAHLPVNVIDLGCDFYVFSSHKCYGPTGVGVLYGRYELLNSMPPYQYGGDMIESVTLEKTTWASLPAKFEAGTPAIAEIIGFGAALDYLTTLGFDTIHRLENDLLAYTEAKLNKFPDLTIIGQAQEKSALVSFVIEGIHPHDIGTILDQDGIAIRAGHHCAQPVMKRFGVPATTRASMSFYNTKKEIDRLVKSLEKAYRLLK